MAAKIEKTVKMNAPIEKVWAAYKDKLLDIKDYMPEVEEIKILEREENGQITNQVNEWTLAASDIPSSIKKFVPPGLLKFTDTAKWNSDAMTCEFVNIPSDGSGLYKISGFNTFLQSGSVTTLTMSLNIEFDAGKIPGVPKFLAKTIMPQVEKLLAQSIAKNLEGTANAVVKFVENEG